MTIKTPDKTKLPSEHQLQIQKHGYYYDKATKWFVCGACGKKSRDALTVVKHINAQK